MSVQPKPQLNKRSTGPLLMPRMCVVCFCLHVEPILTLFDSSGEQWDKGVFSVDKNYHNCSSGENVSLVSESSENIYSSNCSIVIRRDKQNTYQQRADVL